MSQPLTPKRVTQTFMPGTAVPGDTTPVKHSRQNPNGDGIIGQIGTVQDTNSKNCNSPKTSTNRALRTQADIDKKMTDPGEVTLKISV